MDVGTLRALVSETQAATGGVEDPSRQEQDTATHSEEEASSTETTGAKDVAERETQTCDETRMQAGAARQA